MGVVYRAVDLQKTERLGEETLVAVKLIKDNHPEAVGRFRREAKTLLSLQHTHVCRIYDVDQWRPPNKESDYPFIVMPFYEGVTLGRLAHQEEGPLSLPRTLKIVRQIVEGLKYLHDRGIYHRDLKPANIIVGGADDVTILDFGIVKLTQEEDLTATRDGVFLGTPAYMSPEQIRQEAVDHRSDIWALGVILYELSSGRRPFGEGKDFRQRLTGSILNDEPAPLPLDLPPALAEAISRALQKNPADRQQSCDEFLLLFSSLESELADQFPTATLPPGHRSNLPPAARKATSRKLIAVLAMLLAGLGFLLWALLGGSEEAREEMWERRAREAAALGNRDESILAWAQRLRYGDTEPARREMAGVIGSDYARLVATLRNGPEGACTLAFSDDGRYLAVGSADRQGTVRLWNLTTNESFGKIVHGGRVTSLVFHPDGDRLVSGGNDSNWGLTGAARIWKVATQEPLVEPLPHENTITQLRLSDDGETLLTVGIYSVKTWRLATGQQVGFDIWHENRVKVAWFGPQEAVMAMDDGGVVWAWGEDGKRKLGSLAPAGEDASLLAAAGDGRRFLVHAYSSEVGETISAWERKGGEADRWALLREEGVKSFALSPDGQIVLTGDEDGAAHLWSFSGTLESRPFLHAASLCGVAFSPDASRIATGDRDGLVRLWQAHHDQAGSRTIEQDAKVRAVALDAAAGQVATGADDGIVRLWNWNDATPSAAGPELGGVVVRHNSAVTTVSFDAGGGALLSGDRGRGDRGSLLVRTAVPSGQLERQTTLEAAGRVLAESPDGTSLAAALDNGELVILSRELTKKTVPLSFHDPVTALAFDSAGRLVAAGTDVGDVHLSTARGRPLPGIKAFEKQSVTALAFATHGDRNTLAVGSAGGGMVIGALLSDASDPDGAKWKELTRTEHRQRVQGLLFSPAGDELIVATRYWLHAYSVGDGEDLSLQGSSLLPAAWTNAYRFLDTCDACLRTILRSSSTSLVFEIVPYSRSDYSAVTLGADDLYDLWSHRLSLELDTGQP